MEDVKARSCFACIRGTAHCGMCGDELEHFRADFHQDEDEARMDVVGSNGNDGLHYAEEMHDDIDAKKIKLVMPDDDPRKARIVWNEMKEGVLELCIMVDHDAVVVRDMNKTAPGLLKAAADIMQQRAEQYDKPEGERSMGAAVGAFNTITGRDLKESEGWLLLQVLKDVRQWQRPDYHADSAEDCIAYSALKAEALAKGL